MTRDLPTVVISDLDSTLFATEQRHSMADEAVMSGNWDKYSKACVDDDLIVGTAVTLRLLYPYHRIHIASGRSVAAREETISVLESFDIPYDELFLYDRTMWTDKPSNGAIKVQYIEQLKAKGYTVVLFLEDWWETAEAIEAAGVPVLCVNPRYKSGPLSTHL